MVRFLACGLPQRAGNRARGSGSSSNYGGGGDFTAASRSGSHEW